MNMNAKNKKLMCSRFLLAAMILFSGFAASAQTSFQFGITANPLLSWMKSENSLVEKGPRRV